MAPDSRDRIFLQSPLDALLTKGLSCLVYLV
jgi:hypothetical protein